MEKEDLFELSSSVRNYKGKVGGRLGTNLAKGLLVSKVMILA